MGPRAGLEGLEDLEDMERRQIVSLPEIDPRTPSPYPIIIAIKLPQLKYNVFIVFDRVYQNTTFVK
jgi:hypothetical protein